MGSLYRLGQKFVDFCNVVQQNVNNALTVPSSKVLYDAVEDLTYYHSGDTIFIPNTRFIAFGNAGGTVFIVMLYMPKKFKTGTTFLLNGSPYNYSGEMRVGSVNKASSIIDCQLTGNTNIIQLSVNVQSGTGGSMEHGVWVPSSSVTITVP